MKHEIINLKKFYNLQNDVFLETFVSENLDFKSKPKKALIIVPGGGYCMSSNREADPIALAFLFKNYNCFTLRYTCFNSNNGEPVYPKPYLETAAAFDYIYNNAEKYEIKSDKIFMIGFSAGGHLVSTYSYLYKNNKLLKQLGFKNYSHLKPLGICLCYPVITFGASTHQGSRESLIGKNDSLIDLLSAEKHITSEYPSTYLWATKNDDVVPIENSYLLEKELKINNVKHLCHYFDNGPHGLSTSNELVEILDHPEVQCWIDECDKFFRSL